MPPTIVNLGIYLSSPLPLGTPGRSIWTCPLFRSRERGRGATCEAESRKSDQTNTRPPRPGTRGTPLPTLGSPGGQQRQALPRKTQRRSRPSFARPGGGPGPCSRAPPSGAPSTHRRPRRGAEQGPAAPPADALPGPSCRPSWPRSEQPARHGEARRGPARAGDPGPGRAAERREPRRPGPRGRGRLGGGDNKKERKGKGKKKSGRPKKSPKRRRRQPCQRFPEDRRDPGWE